MNLELLIISRNNQPLEFWEYHLTDCDFHLELLNSVNNNIHFSPCFNQDIIILDTYFREGNALTWLLEAVKTIRAYNSFSEIVCVSPHFSFSNEQNDNFLDASCFGFNKELLSYLKNFGANNLQKTA